MIGALIAAVFLGLFVGVLSGLLGIGGGVVMIPAFRLLFGMSALGSTATSLFTIIPTSISGAISHLRNRTCVPKLGLALGIGGACTSPLGVMLANRSPAWLVMLAAAAVVAYSAITMFRKALQAPKTGGKSATQTESANSPAPVPEFRPERRHLAIGLGIGLAAGVISGYVGVGGGFIMIPLMLALIGLPMRQASGTSLIAVMILAIPGAVSQGMLGNVDFVVGIATACGTIPGAFLGAQLTSRVRERTLRFIFAFFLTAAAVLIALKEFGVLG